MYWANHFGGDLAPLWWFIRSFRAEQYGSDGASIYKKHGTTFLRPEKAASSAQQGYVDPLFIRLQLLSMKAADEP